MTKFLKLIRDYLRYLRWILRGKPIPVDHVFKRRRILKIGKLYNCETFIESGTFYGQMVEAVRRSFSLVFSVELAQPLYERNKERFSRCGNVRLLSGDSALRMSEMVAQISGRAIFWLDGHYSGPGTARGTTDCPLLAELDAVREHPLNDHCILIDDARCFNGFDGYPDFTEVERRLLDINRDYHVFVDHDCIIALPPLANGRKRQER